MNSVIAFVGNIRFTPGFKDFGMKKLELVASVNFNFLKLKS